MRKSLRIMLKSRRTVSSESLRVPSCVSIVKQNNFRMLKILNVLFDERIGGPQIRVISVANQLAMRGIETTVVFPEGDPQFPHSCANHKFHFTNWISFWPRSSPESG